MTISVRRVPKSKRIHPKSKKTNKSNSISRKSQTKRQQVILKLRQRSEKQPIQMAKFKMVCAIWGHGGLTQTPFVNEDSHIELNIYGLGVSGCLSWQSVDTQDYINNSLLSGKKLDENLLTKFNNFAVSITSVQKQLQPGTFSAKTSLNTRQSIYSYIKDFGRGKKLRSNKLFAREENLDLLPNLPYPDDMKNKVIVGPVLRIYKVFITDENDNIITQYNDPVDIILPNNSNLSNLMFETKNYAQTLSRNVDLSKFDAPADLPSYIEIDLFDTTCNYTDKAPILAYLENKKIRTLAKRGKIQTVRAPSRGGQTRKLKR